MSRGIGKEIVAGIKGGRRGEENRSGMKKTAAFLLAAGLLVAIFGGCGSDVQTEEEIVVPKDGGGETEEGTEVAGENGETVVADSISAQVQAPERYEVQLESEKVSVNVDADIVIPDAEGFRKKKVTSRVFTQEDYDAVSHVLLQDAPLMKRDEIAMGNSNGFTKSEIQERIDMLKKEMASNAEVSELYGGEAINYEEIIAEWEAMLGDALEDEVLSEIPAVVSYDENETDNNYLEGTVAVTGLSMDNKEFLVAVDNGLTDEWRWIRFQIIGENVANYMPYGHSGIPAGGEGIDREAITKEAEDLLAKLGFTEYGVFGGEYYEELPDEMEELVLEETESKANEGNMAGKIGYGIHCVRIIDGIPVTYTQHTGASGDEGITWPYEELNIIYNEHGFAKFSWCNPYNIEDLSEEYVFLLPFSDIQEIFEEMMLKKYGESDFISKYSFNIDEVRLGYMRVRENGNEQEGMMIPAWDFLGSRSQENADKKGNGQNTYSLDGPYESWLTINAMDGTIIDRESGRIIDVQQ